VTTFAVSLSAFGRAEFWIGVGILVAIYAILTLGLQLNIGYTGIYNFGQVGFMAIGAYAMAVLVVEAGWSFWASLPAATLVAVAFAVLLGLPTLRLRTHYFAIATIAFAEIARYVIQNADGLTGGSQGILGFEIAWQTIAASLQSDLGLAPQLALVPLLIVAWVTLAVLFAVLLALGRSPWGRMLRAVREDEDAVRALGKNAYAYKLQSFAVAGAVGAVSGYLLALYLSFLSPDAFLASVTFISFAMLIVGGLGSFTGVVVGAFIVQVVLEGTRYLQLPLTDHQVASLRYILIGLVLILVMALRPQGILGRREEMVLRG
jgi:branched-chain amino acid transport system permease protein